MNNDLNDLWVMFAYDFHSWSQELCHKIKYIIYLSHHTLWYMHQSQVKYKELNWEIPEFSAVSPRYSIPHKSQLWMPVYGFKHCYGTLSPHCHGTNPFILAICHHLFTDKNAKSATLIVTATTTGIHLESSQAHECLAWSKRDWLVLVFCSNPQTFYTTQIQLWMLGYGFKHHYGTLSPPCHGTNPFIQAICHHLLPPEKKNVQTECDSTVIVTTIKSYLESSQIHGILTYIKERRWIHWLIWGCGHDPVFIIFFQVHFSNISHVFSMK